MVRTIIRYAELFCLIGVLTGCAEGGLRLLVDVKTDFQPGIEFVGVETEIARDAFESTALATQTEAAFSENDFVSGRRVAEFPTVDRGRVYLRVTLRDSAGSIVVRRIVLVEVTEATAVTVLLTRSCRDVECPEAGGDPTFTTCAGGACAPPDCRPALDETCVATCQDASQCSASAACADGVCVDGECFAIGVDARCPAGQFCHPETGCRTLDGTVDAGGMCDATETRCADSMDDDCDGLTDCADPDCMDQACDDGDSCTDTDQCTAARVCAGTALDCDDLNECTTDTCAAGVCDNVNNTIACDDGFWCNGTDSCMDGSCSAHASPPCPLFCNETMMTCEMCMDEADCGSVEMDPYGACGGFSGTCDSTGTQSREVRTPRCNAGSCTIDVTNPSRSCSRTTEGNMCGSTTMTGYGACGGFSDACDRTGTQTRTITMRVCRSDSCNAESAPDSRSCTRAAIPDGTQCGGTWNVCCNGTCRNITTNNRCASCDNTCPGALTCQNTGTGGYACRGCTGNSTCIGFLDGAATCFNIAAPPAWCQCQCGCGPSCTCADGGCGPGFTCHVVPGTNWCAPF